jgi:hypothetical protein
MIPLTLSTSNSAFMKPIKRSASSTLCVMLIELWRTCYRTFGISERRRKEKPTQVS